MHLVADGGRHHPGAIGGTLSNWLRVRILPNALTSPRSSGRIKWPAHCYPKQPPTWGYPPAFPSVLAPAITPRPRLVSGQPSLTLLSVLARAAWSLRFPIRRPRIHR